MKIFPIVLSIVLIAISTEKCISEYLLVEVDKTDTREPKPLPTIRQYTRLARDATANLTTFYSLVVAAGLVEYLDNEGPITAFIPNNGAFSKSPINLENLLRPENSKQLRTLVLRHIVPQKLKTEDIQEGYTWWKTVEGPGIEVTKKTSPCNFPCVWRNIRITIKSPEGRATMTRYNNKVMRNGVIHIIDGVI